MQALKILQLTAASSRITWSWLTANAVLDVYEDILHQTRRLESQDAKTSGLKTCEKRAWNLPS